uniref:Uncharacterized protein LOC105116012 isoform X2 n=1 Tax=Rhizophora mucronata TaxID=61149 RepID=A0A2P2K0M5_RHIMU
MHALFLNYKLHLLMKTKELQHVLLLFLLHTVMCSSQGTSKNQPKSIKCWN